MRAGEQLQYPGNGEALRRQASDRRPTTVTQAVTKEIQPVEVGKSLRGKSSRGLVEQRHCRGVVLGLSTSTSTRSKHSDAELTKGGSEQSCYRLCKGEQSRESGNARAEEQVMPRLEGRVVWPTLKEEYVRKERNKSGVVQYGRTYFPGRQEPKIIKIFVGSKMLRSSRARPRKYVYMQNFVGRVMLQDHRTAWDSVDIQRSRGEWKEIVGGGRLFHQSKQVFRSGQGVHKTRPVRDAKGHQSGCAQLGSEVVSREEEHSMAKQPRGSVTSDYGRTSEERRNEWRKGKVVSGYMEGGVEVGLKSQAGRSNKARPARIVEERGLKRMRRKCERARNLYEYSTRRRVVKPILVEREEGLRKWKEGGDRVPLGVSRLVARRERLAGLARIDAEKKKLAEKRRRQGGEQTLAVEPDRDQALWDATLDPSKRTALTSERDAASNKQSLAEGVIDDSVLEEWVGVSMGPSYGVTPRQRKARVVNKLQNQVQGGRKREAAKVGAEGRHYMYGRDSKEAKERYDAEIGKVLRWIRSLASKGEGLAASMKKGGGMEKGLENVPRGVKNRMWFGKGTYDGGRTRRSIRKTEVIGYSRRGEGYAARMKGVASGVASPAKR